jgi:dienelactone hydrolase
MAEYSVEVLGYLDRIYDEHRQAFSCRATTPMEVEAWQKDASPALQSLIGLGAIESSIQGHQATVEWGAAKVMDGYTRRLGALLSEPGISIPFWFLEPDGHGPFPLGIFPHGHEDRGMDTYVGLYHDEEKRLKIDCEERDVAVQAVRRGFIAIAPNTRGFAPANVPDITARHGDRNCRSQLIHCLLAGRTAIGERVWDLTRLIDWATTLPEVDGEQILMMGNSGGGVATLYAAACDTRITVAVPSCSFCTLVGQNGIVHHCDCNTVPGILGWGGFHDVAGLIAPRSLLIVNGRQDPLFPLTEVDRAVEGVRDIYGAAGVPGRFAHGYGEGGHRFYADLMWPFVCKALSDRAGNSELSGW